MPDVEYERGMQTAKIEILMARTSAMETKIDRIEAFVAKIEGAGTLVLSLLGIVGAVVGATATLVFRKVFG